jgi:hypothetical protein
LKETSGSAEDVLTGIEGGFTGHGGHGNKFGSRLAPSRR